MVLKLNLEQPVEHREIYTTVAIAPSVAGVINIKPSVTPPFLILTLSHSLSLFLSLSLSPSFALKNKLSYFLSFCN